MSEKLFNRIAVWKSKFNLDKDILILEDYNKLTASDYINSFYKRMIDILVSSTLLILLSPLLLLISILLKLTSKGPLLFRWAIIGKNSELIHSYKFRTMVKNAEDIEFTLRNDKLNEMDNIYFKMKHDPRITFFGKFLRKFSLDELPSLYSVAKGELSLVGPRPVRPHEYKELNDWQKLRFKVRPGITSLWVVSGKNEINNFNDIVEIDLYYIANSSFLIDFKIILKTIFIILLGKNY